MPIIRHDCKMDKAANYRALFFRLFIGFICLRRIFFFSVSFTRTALHEKLFLLRLTDATLPNLRCLILKSQQLILACSTFARQRQLDVKSGL